VVNEPAISLYLDLLKRCVTNLIYRDDAIRYIDEDPDAAAIKPFSIDLRMDGKDWPTHAHTMIGTRRLDNIQTLVMDVVNKQIPGDLIETGVWRGGSAIFMCGILKAHGITDRMVWVADSFAGPPRTEEQGLSRRSFISPGLDAMREGWMNSDLPSHLEDRISLLMQETSYEDVRDHFARYGLLDDQVRFLPGWFCDTLASAPIERLALLRLDGGFYDSTHDALAALYPRLSIGGYAIVDDYNTFSECRQAVHDYLDEMGVQVDIQSIDDEAVYWKKGPDKDWHQ